ncbi:cupin domain-containing protein [Frankia sp. R43]|uniref:cupin domain-containing protein n=1 Tax=Frankia sp. R43 TaxID=269536 RepID=UPI001F3C2171|nr:cupin domain-containing protein [Frankia sp. R43]
MSDEDVPPLTAALLAGGAFYRLWGADEAPTFPDDGAPAPHDAYFPPVGGYRFAMFMLAAGSRETPPDLDLQAAKHEMDQKLPGLTELMDPDEPGMHATDTVDLGIVVSGELALELDNAARTVLRAGDTFVQNGTRHRWLNAATEPVLVALFSTGSNRKER